jgi:hypothetical protein
LAENSFLMGEFRTNNGALDVVCRAGKMNKRAVTS